MGLLRVVWRHDWVLCWIQGLPVCPVWGSGLQVVWWILTSPVLGFGRDYFCVGGGDLSLGA